jgi:hypothetical protein
MAGEPRSWPEHAAAEGAAVSADPGESGQGGSAGSPTPSDASDASPSNHLTGGGDPVEGGAADEDGFHPQQAGARSGSGGSPGEHLGPGGDPVEGGR